MLLSAQLRDIDDFETFLERHRDQVYERIVDITEKAVNKRFRKVKMFTVQIQETAELFDFYLMMDSGHIQQYLANAERYFAELEQYEQCQRIQSLKQQIQQIYK